jgi:hypothetical protein
MKRNFVYSSSRMEAGRPVVRLSTQYHFDDGFTPPRIAFVGADPTDPDSIPIHEHVHTSGARLYSAAGTCGGDWQQGMLAFHSYGSAGAGRVEVLPGILHAGPTPVFVMAPEAAYRAVAGLERTSDGCGFYVQAYDPARWMEQTPAIHTKKLRHICLPCSHDAGTAKMQDIKTSDNGDDIAGFMNSLREIGDAIKATGIGIIIDIPLWLSNKLFGLVKGLGRAQSQSIADQLNGGVRGFDLRAYYYANDDEFYTYHGALAEKLETILDEMKAFLEATAGEILYVTFTHQQHVDTQAFAAVEALCAGLAIYGAALSWHTPSAPSCTRCGAIPDLAHRQRSGGSRTTSAAASTAGTSRVRARHAVLPLHLGEPHGLPQRPGARGGGTELRLRRLSDRSRVRPQGDRRGEGLLHPAAELFANVRKRAAKDENLNETLERVFKNIEGSAVGTESEGDLKGLFDDLDVNSSKLGPTVAKRNEKLVKLLDAIGDLPPRALRRQHDRPVRRRLRVPHADVRLAGRQVRG